MQAHASSSARDRIAALAGEGLDLPTFWRESSDALARVVPNYMSPCWYTFDPASLLVTSHFQAEIEEIPAEWLAAEYYEDDFHTMAGVARSERGVSTLYEAGQGRRADRPRAGGDPARAPRRLDDADRRRSSACRRTPSSSI